MVIIYLPGPMVVVVLINPPAPPPPPLRKDGGDGALAPLPPPAITRYSTEPPLFTVNVPVLVKI
jgi:hypothetical protein